MARTFVRLPLIYFTLVAIFVAGKLLFMLANIGTYGTYSPLQWAEVCLHGLPMDLSVAGYLSILPGVFMCIENLLPQHTAKLIWQVYFALVSVLLAIILAADAVLYGYWGFKLDATPLFYLRNPSLAIASASWWQTAVCTAAAAVAGICIYLPLVRIATSGNGTGRKFNMPESAAAFIMTALLIIPIRGGFSVSVMNVGKVYYSTDMALNHAAVNPCFSLLESLSHDNDFAKKYRFMPPKQAELLFSQMQSPDGSRPSVPLLRNPCPNIILVILESFMTECLENGAAPKLDSLSRKGVVFSNFYANSFRTDRGLVSILSGYPSQPTASIMKYPRKSQSLPSIPRSLKEHGYYLRYYYGGDADFTNMRSYLRSCGIEHIISEDDFPDTPKFKWGVHDQYLFERVSEDLKNNTRYPFFYAVQTSSSHEPFEVPSETKKFDDPYLNSVAYTDACLGKFINDLKHSGEWNNTIVILVADHAMRWPETRTNYDVERYRIPFILLGGALSGSFDIDAVGSQMDIAATLLAQMHIGHSQFRFSKNILDFASPHFAYFSAPDLFGIVTRRGNIVWDCASNELARQSGDTTGLVDYGKALLQTLYDDIDAR